MAPWKVFVIGGSLLTLMIFGGILLSRYKRPLESKAQQAKEGARLLVFSLWLASLSILAYIAFVFGKR
jgi:hypothetical protein